MRHRILVPRFDDPAALRESEAVAAGDGRFRLVGSAPRQERLLFKHGEIVECEIRTLPGGSKGLVAIRSVSTDPEYRKKRNVFATLGAIVGAIIGAAIALSFVFSLVSAGSSYLDDGGCR